MQQNSSLNLLKRNIYNGLTTFPLFPLSFLPPSPFPFLIFHIFSLITSSHFHIVSPSSRLTFLSFLSFHSFSPFLVNVCLFSLPKDASLPSCLLFRYFCSSIALLSLVFLHNVLESVMHKKTAVWRCVNSFVCFTRLSIVIVHWCLSFFFWVSCFLDVLILYVCVLIVFHPFFFFSGFVCFIFAFYSCYYISLPVPY